MRVLFINENIGGHANVHSHLKVALEKHPEVEATFIDVPEPTTWRRIKGTRLPGLARLDLDFQALRAQLALSTWVRREVNKRIGEFDVLHVYTSSAAFRLPDVLAQVPSIVATDSVTSANAYRIPTREPTRFTPRAVKAGQRYERPVFESATAVVANTDWIARAITEEFATDAIRLRTFPYGINAPVFSPAAAPGTTAEGLPQVVFVGKQLRRKGALRLIKLHQKHFRDRCEIVIVSTEKPPEAKNVRWVSDVRVGSGRLWEVLREGAIFCFPSTIDQAPNVVIEAMAAGLPVIALGVAAIPDMVPDDCGEILPPGDDDALVGALTGLLDSPARREQVGRAAREHFAATYDGAATTATLVDLCHEVREIHAGRPSR